MPMTLDQIVEETQHLPPRQISELVDRLTLNLHHAIDPEIEQAWVKEVQKRVAELESGQVKEVSGEEVSERIRKIVGR